MESIEDKIKRIQSGEVYLFADIIDIYQNRIYKYCLRLLHSREEAEDAVQDIMLKVYEKIRYYHLQVSFSSWLYKIAYNHCLNLLRKRKLQQQVQRFFGRESTVDSAERVVEKKMFSEPLASALEMLSLEERNLLILRIFEDKSFEEIAEILGKNMEAIKKRYGRIRHKLKESMESRAKEEGECAKASTLLKNRS
ncbi:sigma-70 family RNA polymerase sigma factor [Paenibacillus albidus]|uniref:RNA polymerase sigma factor n=1 Tax=Paenibacillus albidus TaxID=2041023 RepID=UPI001BE5759B|nr:sigma-70 family RNA polymerase sigma factor [Paenibacillus albidus]MBT2289943.1 sigma-70 family RNA polymerase sigma factor [Paenibacillus albidus]